MKNRCYINFFVALAAWISLSCSCHPPDTRIEGFEKAFQRVSDVFIGEVILVDSMESIYVVQVTESFKGKLEPGDRIIGRNHRFCWPNIYRNGEWLFFGENNKECTTEICGHTFCVEDPRIFVPPPPPPPNQRPEQNEVVVKD